MNKRILLIEDDEILLEGLKALLEMHDFDVVTTDVAEKGLELVEQAKPDLIISDYQLPGMTGLDFANQLRVNPGTHHIPMILLTGYPPSQIKKLPTGIEVVTKPFEISAFIDIVEALLIQEMS